MFFFESQLIKTDITAAKILKKYFLVGVGGYLHVFNKSSFKLNDKIHIFEGQKINGIVPNNEENKILLYGGRCIRVITVHEDFTQVDKSTAQTNLDWILVAKWVDDYQQIATVSMHNSLQIWSTSLELITEIKCEEKCILYSAFICYNQFEDLVILSGTVFSEVLIWKPDRNKDSLVRKRLQKHKGVIFSVNYNETSGYICSSSDDRSTVVWNPKSGSLITELMQENIEINILCHVFGHTSRIFRCLILERCFLSAGEDSFLNIWSFDGRLLRKIETHQGGPIWAVDASENDNTILTGGGDCGITLFPINCNFEEKVLSVPNKEVPKIIGCLNNNNLVVFSESGSLYYYITNEKKWLHIQNHLDLKNYALLAVSKCRNLFALAGFHGQICIYKQENSTLRKIIWSETMLKSRIFALHWIDCKTFLVCQNEGRIALYFFNDGNLHVISNFILPPSKERWSTCALYTGKNIVIGDRKGNLHLLELGKMKPIQTLKKVHSHLGVTKLIKQDEKIISLGRNSVIKTFTFGNGILQLISSNKLPYTWLVDIIEDLLLAFSGDKFVIWNHKTKRVIFEKSCGGGHRSWDFLQMNNNILFSYIKEKTINLLNFNLYNFSPVDLIESYQIREINSMEAINVFNNYIVISGGEDTTLRINLTKGSNFDRLVSLKPHLSSIRTLATYSITQESNVNKKTYLVFSGGGRAQIICWKLEIFTHENCLKYVVFSEQDNYYKITDESETRIMNLNVTNLKKQLLLLAACSDGNVKLFFVEKDNFGRYHLRFYRDIFYKLKCILKLCIIYIFSKEVLVTMATDGLLVFWDISDILNQDSEITFFSTIKSHQSGINSCAFKVVGDDLCLFLTGGDDNTVTLNLIRLQNVQGITAENLDTFTDSSTHCGQITGVFLSDKYFLTASIDQRIAIFQWHIFNKKIICQYVSKYNTAVADIQGLCCFDNSDYDLFIYGKGIEYIKIKKKI